MDNYYSSPKLMEEIYLRSMFSAGTCCSNRKCLPKAVTLAKLKPGESCFHRAGSLLCIKWCDKQSVLFLSTIHDAVEINTGEKDRHGNPTVKPKSVHEYTMNMRGCDLSDQLMTSYSMRRCSVKWWRKLFFHIFSLCINNAYILYKKFNTKCIPHDKFMEQLAKSLIDSSLQSCTIAVTRPRPPTPPNPMTCLHERHFPSPIGKTSTKSRSKKCSVCNFGKKALIAKGYKGVKLPCKLTSYMCNSCNIPICIYPCFELYQAKDNYQDIAFHTHISNM